LNGKTKSESDFEETRKFGFKSVKYRYNRGHWKLFNETDGSVEAFEWSDSNKFSGNLNRAYATDFLFDRAQEYINKNIKKGKPYALTLSIADPHAPNDVRPPYDSMFNDMNFDFPDTGAVAMRKQPMLPGWAALDFDPEEAEANIAAYQDGSEWQTLMRKKFGMIKLIDDRVGKLLRFLKRKDQTHNTIIVFTSDHGDMMGEHARDSKGVPYKSSASVPMIITWPGKIQASKTVETSYSSVDFLPTLLGLMGVDFDPNDYQGIDGSDEILSSELVSTSNQTRFFTDSKKKKWAAAVNHRYKMVVSRGEPWFFDMQLDPDELTNYFDDIQYKDVVSDMKNQLIDAMVAFQFPLTKRLSALVNTPACNDAKDQLEDLQYRICSDFTMEKYSSGCKWPSIAEKCPFSCNNCQCEDSEGDLWLDGSLKTCSNATDDTSYCSDPVVQKYCRRTCGLCTILN